MAPRVVVVCAASGDDTTETASAKAVATKINEGCDLCVRRRRTMDISRDLQAVGE
jgi:hypothetical protein